MSATELLTTDQMYRADAYAISHGTPGAVLMERAGRGVVDSILAHVPRGRVLVLCGPGNNGGDGFVIARHLVEEGWSVHLVLISGTVETLKGDASVMAGRWAKECDGEVLSLDDGPLPQADLVVDAVFGAGLTRPVDGPLADLIAAYNADPAVKIVAVDVPSGVDGTSGAVLGTAFQADLTVTFHAKKPAHLLFSANGLMGEVEVVDIGIPPAATADMGIDLWENTPALWGAAFPQPEAADHKYTKGHALVCSGPMAATGAARLAAMAALRVGAGLVTIGSPPDALMVNAAHLTSIMLRRLEGATDLTSTLSDKRFKSLIIGPGHGVGERTREMVLAGLKSGVASVLDADALTSFVDDPSALFAAIQAAPSPVVMTPHEGEFTRLFGALEGNKLARARAAAAQSGAVVVLKGPDSVIAATDGRAAINGNAGPELGTAGSGDVLAGIIGGLLAQDMPGFEAASASVWLHGAAGQALGRGLIAEDLPHALPPILQALEGQPG